ncbi:minor tail protein [Arthrobacter phage Bauer]|uniref:Minor tail protein n=1 Tax=Arthrobacter phage Bauer TaxID=2985648 RepID=A0A9E8AAS7_9CAUD|nr:minor tail protein [Arthrobacter phage Bauer]UUG69980.1 minor tail protein [Arthrobacter phage Zucker]UYM26570.1 minor tail protein [Arthrobacter phage Bauer]
MDGLKITVFDKDFQRKGWLGSPESVTCTPVFNGAGTADVTFPANHLRAADILTEGARLVIDMDGLPIPLMSGPVTGVQGEGPAGQSSVTATITDDIKILWETLGWQVPTAAISAQGTAEYRTYTGNAETIVKTMVQEQAVTRFGHPLTVAPNLNRGAVISGGVKIRMHPLAERLFPAVEQAGLGVRVYQSGAGLVLDVYEPRTYMKEISEAAGTLRSWKWNRTGPTATHVVGGGRGEGTARTFRRASDSALADLYGRKIEVFADARNSETDTDVDQSNSEVLFENRPNSGLELELSETPYFRYGTVVVGDQVPIRAGDLLIMDILRSATITWDRAGGLKVQPVAGKLENSSDARVNKAIRTLWRGLTNLKVR